MQDLEMNISLPNQIVIYMQLRMGCPGSACSFAKGKKRGGKNISSQVLNRTKIPNSFLKLKERSGIKRGLCNRGCVRGTPFCAHVLGNHAPRSGRFAQSPAAQAMRREKG